MTSQDDYRKHLQAMPADIREAHVHSSNHRTELMNSDLCGCFYCCQIFAPSEITMWLNPDPGKEEETALCPNCTIDSVIGDKSGFPITEEFLRRMKAYWF
jgi:hypothetical protein